MAIRRILGLNRLHHGVALLLIVASACSASLKNPPPASAIERECSFNDFRCAEGETCAYVDLGKSICAPFVEATFEMSLPLPADGAYWCGQGGRSAIGRSHSFLGDLFAVDLYSTSLRDDVEILAPTGGMAYVFDDCDDERDGAFDKKNNSNCGLGYGNHVKIWDGTDLYLLAHLATVRVKPGRVEKNQVIGTMGSSGAAGDRHLHLTVTRPRPQDDAHKIFTTPGWKGRLPVRFRLAARHSVTGEPIVGWTDEFSCAHNREKAGLIVR